MLVETNQIAELGGDVISTASSGHIELLRRYSLSL
jgi:hypothetical protein